MTTTKNELIDLTLSSDDEEEEDDNINLYNAADFLPIYELYDPTCVENSDNDSSDDDNEEEEVILIEEDVQEEVDVFDVAEVVVNEIEELVVNNEPEVVHENVHENVDDEDEDEDDDGIDGYTELVDDEQELRRLARKHVIYDSDDGEGELILLPSKRHCSPEPLQLSETELDFLLEPLPITLPVFDQVQPRLSLPPLNVELNDCAFFFVDDLDDNDDDYGCDDNYKDEENDSLLLSSASTLSVNSPFNNMLLFDFDVTEVLGF